MTKLKERRKKKKVDQTGTRGLHGRFVHQALPAIQILSRLLDTQSPKTSPTTALLSCQTPTITTASDQNCHLPHQKGLQKEKTWSVQAKDSHQDLPLTGLLLQSVWRRPPSRAARAGLCGHTQRWLRDQARRRSRSPGDNRTPSEDG